MTRHLARWELAGVDGPVVVVDVIRAFTTAAYAFGSGAVEIFLVGTGPRDHRPQRSTRSTSPWR